MTLNLKYAVHVYICIYIYIHTHIYDMNIICLMMAAQVLLVDGESS